jgi:hypothetical protein
VMVSRKPDQYRQCMVRRRTAREKVWARRQVCGNVFGLWVEISLLAMMSSAACLSLQVGRSLKTIIGIRLKARRCDCSFVVAVPVQSSVGELEKPLVWRCYWGCKVKLLRGSAVVCSLVRSTVRPMRCVPACSPWQPRRRSRALWHLADPATGRWPLDLA